MIIKIKERKYDFFNGVSINLKYDSVASTYSFNLFFNPENDEQRELLHVGHFHTARIEHEGELLITGPLLSTGFISSSKDELTSIGGYALPGVLTDCNIPLSLYPLQADGLNLREIAQKLINPFKLKMVIDPDVSSLMNKPYKKSTADEGQTISQYLIELATQRDIIISHTFDGELLFTKAKTNKEPILKIEPNGQKVTKMTLDFNGQNMHSDITVQKQADSDGGNESEFTIKNPFVPFVFRPKVLSQSSGDDNDSGEAARNALAAELKNLTLTIELDTWTIDDKVIQPNNIVSVLDPDIYLYTKTKWFIESVALTGNEKRQVSKLNCVLPSVYDKSTPVNIFENGQ